MSDSETWSYQTSLDADPLSASRARTFVSEHLARHDLGHMTDDMSIVVSELASNAILHTYTPFFTLRMKGDETAVMVSVDDSSPSFERSPVPPLAMDIGGRGLVLTEGLCHDWGVTIRPDGGKSVWATFTVLAADRASGTAAG